MAALEPYSFVPTLHHGQFLLNLPILTYWKPMCYVGKIEETLIFTGLTGDI